MTIDFVVTHSILYVSPITTRREIGQFPALC